MTVKEIAKLAKVSEAAVSIALNHKKGVSEVTRKRILAIANEHNYKTKPKKIKGEEGKQKNVRFLACVGEGIVNSGFSYIPFFGDIIERLTVKCKAFGYNLLLSSVNLNNLAEELAQTEGTLHSDGIILLATNLTQKEVMGVYKIQKNLVVIDNNFKDLNIDCITMNNELGGYQAASHLYRLGHRKMGYVQSKNATNNLFWRKRGFTAFLEENNLSLNKDYYVEGTLEESMVDYKQLFLEYGGDFPTAFACENDYVAISFIKALQKNGIRVPEDISVVGFDNINNATVISPELTTIHVLTEDIGDTALNLLASVMEGKKNYTCKLLIDTKLIKRNSTQQIKSI